MTFSDSSQKLPETPRAVAGAVQRGVVAGRLGTGGLLRASGSLLAMLGWLGIAVAAAAAEQGKPAAAPEQAASAEAGAAANAPQPPEPTYYIAEYRIQGARSLPRIAVEEAVYPYLGPGRTQQGIEQARVALEKAYRDKGYQAISVLIPEQRITRGIVVFQVAEGTVGRLRVRGARYFLPSEVRREAPSLKEGRVVDFNNITHDIMALNRLADRRVEPSLKQGEEPGTVDIDLNVKDTFPLHGSLELNNRYNASTTHLRVNGALSYSNLWQLGHTLGMSFQLAPERISDANIFSGYYMIPVPCVEGLNFMVQGTRQDSDVATLGTFDSVGRGETIGGRFIFTLPKETDFFHSITFGIDYKHYEATDVTIAPGTGPIPLAPVTYYPLSLSYDASWVARKSSTDLEVGLTFNLRGMSYVARDKRGPSAFYDLRYKADDNFAYVRGSLSHTHELPAGFQAFAKVQGQIADQPLVSPEQFGAGGMDTVRGYLESTALGDSGYAGTAELRTPSFGSLIHAKPVDDWRFFAFFDGGVVTLRNPLPQQTSSFSLASIGAGSRLRLVNHLNGTVVFGLPLIGQGATHVHDWLLTFRVWADF